MPTQTHSLLEMRTSFPCQQKAGRSYPHEVILRLHFVHGFSLGVGCRLFTVDIPTGNFLKGICQVGYRSSHSKPICTLKSSRDLTKNQPAKASQLHSFVFILSFNHKKFSYAIMQASGFPCSSLLTTDWFILRLNIQNTCYFPELPHMACRGKGDRIRDGYGAYSD